MKSRKMWFVVEAGVVLLIMGAVLMLLRPWEGESAGFTLSGGLYNWAQNASVTFNTDVSGKTYTLADTFTLTQNMRFGMATLPTGWHVTENSGSGNEAAVYNIASDDKKSYVKTNNMTNGTGKLFNTQSECSEYWAQRIASSDFMEKYKIAAPGTTTIGQTSKYVIATDNGDGVEMYRIGYSYKDLTNITHYSVILYRCGGSNSIQINVNGTVSEDATNELVASVVKNLVLKGAI